MPLGVSFKSFGAFREAPLAKENYDFEAWDEPLRAVQMLLRRTWKLLESREDDDVLRVFTRQFRAILMGV